jgi:hypothetical protein
MQPNEACGEFLVNINGSVARAYLFGVFCKCEIGSVAARGDGNAVITGVSAVETIGEIGGRLTKTGF